jgi:RNA polymerase sigma-70 factor (ECF subfamily)
LTDYNRKIKQRFEELFEAYKNHVYDYAVRMLGDADGAGDIAQEAFIRLYEQLQNGPEIDNPKNWLFIISRNLCLNKIRNGKNDVPLEKVAYLKCRAFDGKNADIFVLEKALETISPKFKEAIVLREYQGFAYDEMATILGVSVPAVRSLLYKARCSLKENFRKIKAGRLSI